jgi:hypothetical protein
MGCIHKNSTLHYNTGKLPSSTLTFTADLTVHCATRLTRNTTKQNSTLTLVHTNTVQICRLRQNVSPEYVEVSQLIGSLNTCIQRTYYAEQCWEQVPPEFRFTSMMERPEQAEIFDFQLPDHGTFVRRELEQSQKLHSQLVGLVTAAMYQVPSSRCSYD